MVWINQINQPTKALVICIKKTEKGLILITPEYDCFLYSSNQTAKFILEALEAWCSTDNIGVELWIQPNKKTKLGFDVIPGKELVYFTGNNLWSINEPELAENPFLVKESKQPIIPPNPLMIQREKSKAKKVAGTIHPESHQPPETAS